jgi:hypothetical protein
MAASLAVEEELGTFVRSTHPHNGYYAGDFSRPRPSEGADLEPVLRHLPHQTTKDTHRDTHPSRQAHEAVRRHPRR